MILLLLVPLFVDALRLIGVPLWWSAVGIALFLWLMKGLSAQKLDVQWSSDHWLLLLIGALAVFSVSSPIGSPLLKLYRAVSFCALRLLLVFFLVNLIRNIEQLRRAMYTVIALSAGSAIIALWQFWMYQETGLILSFAEGEQMFRHTAVGSYLRSTALSTDPNAIAVMMATSAIWCACFGLSAPGLRQASSIGYLILYFILAGGVYVTFSRSTLLSLLVVSLALPFVMRPLQSGRIAAIYAFVSIGIVVSGGFQRLSEFVLGETSGGLDFRGELLSLGLRAIFDYPLTGVGIHSFGYYNNSLDASVHNLLIQAASEIGVGGFLVLSVLLVTVGVRLVVAARRAENSRTRELIVTLMLGYILMLMAYMSGPFLLDPFLWIYMGLMEAAVLVCRSDASREERNASYPEVPGPSRGDVLA